MGPRTQSSIWHVAALCAAVGIGACGDRSATSLASPETLGSNAAIASTTARLAAKIGAVLRAGDPGVVDLTLDIRADRDLRPISPMIYGYNGGPAAENQRWGLIRNGGNRTTAYNWETNASNAGSDYLFQNDDFVSKSDEPAAPLLETMDLASSIAASSVITISNADHVAADKNGGGDVRQSGADYLSTRFKRNLPRKRGPFATLPDPADGAVYQDELVAYLKARRPGAKVIFSMDNEPDLWAYTHAEIFPKAVTYADLWKRNSDFAQAVKDVWPESEVAGLVSYGYAGFESLQNATDAAGRNLIEWYLEQAKAADKARGHRLIDYLDVHWYPEARGGEQRIVGASTSAAVVAAREQAPRSLWDPKYEEASWVYDSAGGPIELLHRLQAKIDRHYPGTKLAVTEWNYGAGHHISGAIAAADVLGVFGRHGVSLAAYWPMQSDESFAMAAMRAYRNYDGQASRFGDTAIFASSSDVPNATVYASLESMDPSRMVVIAINKAATHKRAGLRIAHSAVYTAVDVFVLSGSAPVLKPGPVLSPIATNAFAYDMPAQSVSVLVPRP